MMRLIQRAWRICIRHGFHPFSSHILMGIGMGIVFHELASALEHGDFNEVRLLISVGLVGISFNLAVRASKLAANQGGRVRS